MLYCRSLSLELREEVEFDVVESVAERCGAQRPAAVTDEAADMPDELLVSGAHPAPAPTPTAPAAPVSARNRRRSTRGTVAVAADTR